MCGLKLANSIIVSVEQYQHILLRKKLWPSSGLVIKISVLTYLKWPAPTTSQM